jgi:hypothetical protein
MSEPKEIITFPRAAQAVSGLARESDDPRSLEIRFAAAVTDDELIGLWLFLKSFVVPTTRALGWESSNKTNEEEWKQV